MATDISTVKSSIATDGTLPSAKGPAQTGGSGIDFAEIIRKNGSRLDSGLTALSDRAGITGIGERPDNVPTTDDRSYDRGDDRNDNTGSRADANYHADYGSDRDVSSNSERSGDFGNDRSQGSEPETANASGDVREDSQYTENRGETANRDDRSDNSSDHENASTQKNSDSETANASDGDDGEQTSVKGKGENKTNNANTGENANNTATAATAKQMLNTLLANAQNSALPGQASEQAGENTQDNLGRNNAAEGLNTAIANAGKQAGGNNANAGQSGANTQNQLTQAQTHNLSGAQGQMQAQNNTNAQMQAAPEAQGKDAAKTTEQAAQLSKMVGNGNKVEVSVNITDEKSALVSKPTANLASNTVLAADASAPSLRSQQAQGLGNTNAAGQAQQAAGQAAGATGQIQQAVQQAGGSQVQSANTAALDAKGAFQGNLHNGGTQATLSGNGDTPVAAAPNSISAAQQVQQNTSTQAANSTRFTAANHAVADQVSVQISKALNAGNDRISIQLKPAGLGRVDIQMEVGQDGRVIAVVTADNKNTLDLLQRDAKELQQALQQAGLQADDDSLNFNLREQGDGREIAGSSANGGDQGMGESGGDELTLEEELAGLKRDIITDTRVDVRA